MRKNKTFYEWYNYTMDCIRRALELIEHYSLRVAEITNKKETCKNFEQRLFFERDVEVDIRTKNIYKKVASRNKRILITGINVHFARAISRGLKVKESEIGSKKEDYLATAFISRDICISQIDSLFNKMDKED